MKARLAKKIVCTPIDRLSSRWIDRWFRCDARVCDAVRVWRKNSWKKAWKAGNKNVNIKT